MSSSPQPDLLPIIYTDRSRIETAEHCLRKRYYQYHYSGTLGLERTSLAIDLEVGKTIHDILADLMVMLAMGAYNEVAFQTSIATHLAEFDKGLRERGVEFTSASGYEQQEDGTIAVIPPNIELAIGLYNTLIRNLVTAWAAVRAPYYVQTYRIISVEQEHEMPMADGRMLFLMRPDAVLQRLEDGQYFVLNFKSTGNADQWWQEQWRHDMQTLSEVLPIEAQLGCRVSGVLIEGLVKGPKKCEYPRDSGTYWPCSPLIWAWMKPAAPPFPPEYASRWKWTGEDGRGHTLGKGYTRQGVWETELGAEGWLQWLMEHDRELVEQQFVALPPISRQDAEVESWLRQTIAREIDIAQKADYVNELANINDPAYASALDANFPQSTSGGNCIRPGKCEMYSMCWGEAAADPLNSGYQVRVPNHPKEAEVSNGH